MPFVFFFFFFLHELAEVTSLITIYYLSFSQQETLKKICK